MKKKNTPRKFTLALLAVVVLLLVGDLGASFYMIDYALSNKGHELDEAPYERAMERYPELRPWTDSLKREGLLRDTFIITEGGERHHALFAQSERSAGRTALLVHGYHDQLWSMMHIARIYNQELGYNIILPDLHGHGKSSGDDIQMGWNDRLDVLRWANVAQRRFSANGDTVSMVVHGVSMGAATTMSLSGEQTPGFIKCFVEDCGYTSVWDEFVHELKDQFGLPPFPILYTSNWLCRMKYGWDFREASPLAQVAKCLKPMLFIHGDKDDFVPTWMVYPLYEAKPQPKQLWIAKGSAHAQAYRDHRAEYTQQVAQFVGRWIK